MTAQNWWNALAWGRPPDMIIGDPKRPYMKRWYLVRSEEHSVYLHLFLRDDDDRALHDHPWDSTSTLLEGCIREIDEETPEGRIIRPGQVRHRTAEYAHRIEVLQPSWSLFVTGKRRRDWGFHCPKGWVIWTDFVSPGNKGEIGPGCGE